MRDATERAALVALLRTGSQPWNMYADAVEQRGSALAVLNDEVAGRRPQASLFADDADEILSRAKADMRRWSERGMTLLTVVDEGYPENLRAVYDRPPFIFVAGGLQPADSRSIAVVGARLASPQGVARARAIAEHLVREGYVVASGLAAGVDTAAHTAALASGGRTIAVIGTGLDRAYPPENAELQRRIAAQCAVISQFWPDSPPSRRSFPMRNAVMSGVSLATVVVEASQTSGSRMQARVALAHGRPVFLLESLLDQDWARECAARPGAHVVRRPSDITTVVERLTSSGALVA
ncbi:MAG: DNA-protecting protein DprA [Solirubrobacterales bacterium]|nr:DNA-protecting protein DprA [Solirubrobacterales bacterium]